MPSKDVVKLYVPNSYYHVYNRGVEKRDIFIDDQDHKVFLSYLKHYLSPPDIEFSHPLQEMIGFNLVRVRPLPTFAEQVSLLSYCLMTNHFHLLLHQVIQTGVTEFVRALCTSYSMYFNKKYHRVGHLFQGVFKAACVDTDAYLLHLTRYIHRNPVRMTGLNPVTAREYPYSSYPYYLRLKQAAWLHPEHILDYFRSAQSKDYRDFLSYESFVEDYGEDSKFVIGKVAID